MNSTPQIACKIKENDFQAESNSSDSSSDLSEEDEEEEEENKSKVFSLIDRMKRSRSSVAFSSPFITNSDDVKKKSRTNLGQSERPKTSFAKLGRLPYEQNKDTNKHKENVKKYKEQKKCNMLELTFLIDNFLINTPKNVEKTLFTGANEKIMKENEEKRKSQIRREKENAQKKDMRYFELIGCLSEKKLL